MASIGGIAAAVVQHRNNLTKTQSDMVAAAPDEQKPFLTAQFRLQNESEATSQITNILKRLGDQSNSVIQNM